MEKSALKNDYKAKGRKVSFSLIYEPSTIELFWDETSDEVKKTVNAAAHEPQTDLLAKELSRKLPRKDKEYLNGTSARELENLLQTYLDGAIERQKAVMTSRRKVDRVERKTTNFLNNFHSYVEAYSGVIQLMNGVPGGGGYGDAAYGALSLFLVVAVNKVKTEELINAMMHDLHQQYCRIKMVNEVYTTDRMKEHTAKVYRLGIEFLYTAIRYYSMGTFRKILHVAARPPSMQLANKISEIRDAIGDMRQEMKILDGVRLERIERKLEMTAAQLDTTTKHVEALRTKVDQERLDHLHQLLGIRPDEVDPSLGEYEELLARTFDMRNPPSFDVGESLFQNSDFQAWRKTDDTNLLILRGLTFAPEQTDLSWLSPGAIQVVKDFDKLFRTEAVLLLRHFCRVTDDWNSRKSEVVAQGVLRSLIFQLLRNQRSETLIRDDKSYSQVKRDIKRVNEVDTDRSTEIAERLFDVLGNLLETSLVDRLLIVIDRLDEVVGDLEVFIDPLLALIAKDRCKVKVLLTVRTPRSLKEDRVRRTLGAQGYRILDIDQGD